MVAVTVSAQRLSAGQPGSPPPPTVAVLLAAWPLLVASGVTPMV